VEGSPALVTMISVSGIVIFGKLAIENLYESSLAIKY